LSPEPIVPLSPDWPAMSLAQAHALLTAPGARFEMETLDIRGVPTRVWKNAPPSVRVIAQLVRAYGEREFTVHEDERVTFEANYRATCHLAHKLVEMGVGKGDRVALAMRNLPEWPTIFFAIASIGAIVVPLNAWWTGAELEYGLTDSAARVLFVDGERHERLKHCYDQLPALERVVVSRAKSGLEGKATPLEALVGACNDWAALPDVGLPDAEVGPEDDLTIFYTSGTTGSPKGALGTHRNICSNILSSGYVTARGTLRRPRRPSRNGCCSSSRSSTSPRAAPR
jgi:long-chain acyl-CoA synthetase